MGRTTRSKKVLADKTNVRRVSIDKAAKKTCVYQSKETVDHAKDDGDIYEFEFDIGEEPARKSKKRRIRTQKPTKTAVKRLKGPAKTGAKKKRSPKQKVAPTAAPSFPKNRVVQNISPNLRILPKIPTNFQAHVPAALRKDSLPITTACASPNPYMSSPPMSHVSSVCPSPRSPIVRPESPPLENLFDDDDDDTSFAIPQQAPTRFDYQELAEARARVIRTSLTPRNVIPAPLPPPARDSSPEPSKMKQTSILNFISGPQEVQDGGLFSCSTPVRSISPGPCSMLSPVRVEEFNPMDETNVEVDEEPEEEAEKQAEVVKDKEPRCAPMRLTLHTLKQVMVANKEAQDKEKLPSPKKHFSRPARKSYEKRSKRKAPDFFELENDHESDIENEIDGDQEEEEEATIKKKPKRMRKEEKNVKAFDDWADKFNKELEDYEEFDLAVE